MKMSARLPYVALRITNKRTPSEGNQDHDHRGGARAHAGLSRYGVRRRQRLGERLTITRGIGPLPPRFLGVL